jgi:peptidoglycan-N-acetylglucosamine deacetylase
MKRCTRLFIGGLFLFIISCGEQTKVETASTPVVLNLTAETGKPLGPEIKYMPEWKAFGWFTAKDSVEWQVDVPEAGEYSVQMEWSVSDEDAGKEFILIAANDQLKGIVDKSGSWETYKTKDIGTINLEKGKQKFIFRSNTKFDEGAILDLRALKLEKK